MDLSFAKKKKKHPLAKQFKCTEELLHYLASALAVALLNC